MCFLPQPEKFLLKNLNPGKVKGFANTTLAYFLPFEKIQDLSLICSWRRERQAKPVGVVQWEGTT